MLKFLPLVKPREGMTIAECLDHYKYNHSLIATEQADFNRFMPKYVHNYPLTAGVGPRGELSTEWASLSEDYFYSFAAYQRAMGLPCYEIFREDEVRFANFDELRLVAATAAPVFGPAEDTAYKIWRFADYGDGVSNDDGRMFWEVEYAIEVARDERLRRILTSYVQNRPVDGFSTSFPDSRGADVCDEFWIKSLDLVPEFLEAERDLQERLGFAERIDASSTDFFVAEAKVLWDLGEDPAAAFPRIRRWDQAAAAR
jgi:hypothetical protein